MLVNIILIEMNPKTIVICGESNTFFMLVLFYFPQLFGIYFVQGVDFLNILRIVRLKN